MIESVKLKIFATILHLFSADLEKGAAYRDPEELCKNVDRLEVMAEAITVSTHNRLCSEAKEKICWKEGHEKLAFYMTSMAYNESKFLERIHAGKCQTNECDPVFKWWNGQKYLAYHKAKTPWQLHKTIYVKDAEWDTMLGTDLESTLIAAYAASRVFTWSRNRCKSDIGGFALYATGKRCRWEGAGQRVFLAHKYMKLSQNPKWVDQKIAIIDQCN